MALLALLPATAAHANLRAPRILHVASSGAIGGAVPSLRVLGERLGFACAESCAVTARYRVQASQGGHYAFEFLLPIEAPVSARVGTTVIAVEARQTALGSPGWPQHHNSAPPQYAARFEADLIEGESEIEVSYQQPLGAHEYGYGYFSKGRFVEEFDYLLGPLKEWTLGPEFTIAVTVSMAREPPGWWKRKCGKVRSLTCRDGDAAWDAPALDRGGTREQKDQRYVLSFTLHGNDFPNRMSCQIGDEDLLPKSQPRQ